MLLIMQLGYEVVEGADGGITIPCPAAAEGTFSSRFWQNSPL